MLSFLITDIISIKKPNHDEASGKYGNEVK